MDKIPQIIFMLAFWGVLLYFFPVLWYVFAFFAVIGIFAIIGKSLGFLQNY